MSHQAQQAFFAELAAERPQAFTNCRVLEVGSLNINGTIRKHFSGCDYTGVDLGPGPGVDLVCEGQNLTFPDGHFDTTVSAECFEHNPYWAETFGNMVRMTRSGGLVAFSCASTGRPEHGTTRAHPDNSPLTISAGWDYYRNLTEQDFIDAHPVTSSFSDWQFTYNPEAFDLYFWGVRR